MDWTQALTIILSNFGVMLVLFVYLMSRMDSNQKQTNEKLNSLENRMTGIEVEMRGMNQRLSNVENCVMPRKVFRFEETEHKDEPKEN